LGLVVKSAPHSLLFFLSFASSSVLFSSFTQSPSFFDSIPLLFPFPFPAFPRSLLQVSTLQLIAGTNQSSISAVVVTAFANSCC
jgi:hypothetical protein